MAEKFHAFGKDAPERFARDMGYNQKEFFRILPAAIGEHQFSKSGNTVTITHPNKTHEIKLIISPLPDRKLGSFCIQHIDVQFSFTNMPVKERSEFMQHFDRRYQRGGG